MSRKFILLLFIIFLKFEYSQSQQISDSLNNKSFEELESYIKSSKNNTEVILPVAKVYLRNAKLKEDTIYIALGYKFMSKAYKPDYEKCIIYIDSAISISVNLKHNIYPALLYTNKGVRHSQQGKYKKALDSYLKAIEFSKKYWNEDLFYANTHNLAFLKSELGLHKEALGIYKKTFKYEANKKIRDSSMYLMSHYVLSNSYTFNKLIDSASMMNKEGVKMAKKSKDIMYGYILNEGINEYHKAHYKIAIDSIVKTIPSFSNDFDKGLLMQAYLYLGKSYEAINDTEKTLSYYKKIDSIFRETKYVLPQTREPYEFLINYYKKKNDKNLQLHYIEKLIEVDSVLDNNYQYLSLNITKKYDTPLLLSEKEDLIEELLVKKEKSNNLIWILIFILSFSFIGFYFYYKKQRLYKKRFEELIADKKKESRLIKSALKTKKELNIPKELINSILEYLEKFEEENIYLDRNINLTHLSEKIGTNTKYLSNIINHYKQKNFKSYLNDLRIDYVVNTLQSDSKLRKYEIKAIAREVGFNNAESFSNAFYKKTGIYPSFFIKQLEDI